MLFIVGIGTLLSALAGSMINLALPDLGRELGLSIVTSRWVVQAYLLATSALMLVAGRLSDLLSHRRIYLSGFALFGAGSLACGLSASFAGLIVARVLQGIGGALLMAASPALLTTSVPPEKRGQALGILSTATYVGLSAGPPLGGALVSFAGWRWTFLVNVPVALLVLGLGIPFLPRTPPRKERGFDLSGAATLLVALPLLMLVATNAQHWGGAAFETWLTFGLGAIAFAWFLFLQARPARRTPPLLDLRLFRVRAFSGAVVSAVLNYVSLFVVILLVPFYLEEGLGQKPAVAGLWLSLQPLLMAAVASPSGWLSDRLGSRGLSTIGMLILAVGLYGASTLGPESSTGLCGLWLAVMGLGTGIFISPNSSTLMGAAPRAQQGLAGSVLAESRVVGMLLGVALGTAIFDAFGGQTGARWRPEDFDAFRLAVRAAVLTALLGALAASLRGPRSRAGS